MSSDFWRFLRSLEISDDTDIKCIENSKKSASTLWLREAFD
jgi:hypothetical protein